MIGLRIISAETLTSSFSTVTPSGSDNFKLLLKNRCPVCAVKGTVFNVAIEFITDSSPLISICAGSTVIFLSSQPSATAISGVIGTVRFLRSFSICPSSFSSPSLLYFQILYKYKLTFSIKQDYHNIFYGLSQYTYDYKIPIFF